MSKPSLSCPHGNDAFACECCFPALLATTVKELIELIDAGSGQFSRCPQLMRQRQVTVEALGRYSALFQASDPGATELTRRLITR